MSVCVTRETRKSGNYERVQLERSIEHIGESRRFILPTFWSIERQMRGDSSESRLR